MKSSKDRIIIKENPLFDEFNLASNLSRKESHLEIMSVIMAEVTVEAAMAEMEKKVTFLLKAVEE